MVRFGRGASFFAAFCVDCVERRSVFFIIWLKNGGVFRICRAERVPDRLHLDLGVLGVEPDVRVEITVMMVGVLVLVGVLMLAVGRPQLNVLGRLNHGACRCG